MCRFLIVLVASCRAGKGVRVGDEAEDQVQRGAGGRVVVVVMMLVVAEVGEGRLGAVRIPSTVRADKERKLRAETSAGADCDCGCRNAQVDGRRPSRKSRWVWVSVGIGGGVVRRRA